MGADIHFVIEQKHHDRWVGVFSSTGNYDWQPPWELRNDASPLWKFGERNYQFFGNLAGVRREGPTPLGIPEDASSLVQMYTDHWGDDGHSHSYLPLKEFVRQWIVSDAKRLTEAVCDKIEGDEAAIYKALNLDPKYEEDTTTLENSRVVFWFDN
jgi:hypothetical protein